MGGSWREVVRVATSHVDGKWRQKAAIEESQLTVGQIWGFEILDGKRYYVRHVVVRKKDDWKQAPAGV